MKVVALVVPLWIAACTSVARLMPPRDRLVSFVVLILVTFSAWYLWPQVAEGFASPCRAAVLAQMGVTSSIIVPGDALHGRASALAAKLQQQHPHIPVGLQCVAAYYWHRYR